MIRFRLVEDERRYLVLRTELYLRLAQSGADASVLSDVLRNLGKIESFVYAEGIRQGAVAAAVCKPGPAALDLHYEAYGNADTPLREVEKAHWGQNQADGVFEEKPLEFAPLTLTEAKKFYSEKRSAEVELSPAQSSQQMQTSADVLTPAEQDEFEAIEIRRPQGDDEANEHLYEVSSPDFLDRVRDELQAVQRGGTKPATWTDLVYHLHTALSTDAGAIDLQLSTHEGRAVLDQAGFFDLLPGESFDMAVFLDAPPHEAP